MKQVPNNEQCEMLMRKHGIREESSYGTSDGERPIYTSKTPLCSLIREAYRLGRDADVMKTTHKKEEKK